MFIPSPSSSHMDLRPLSGHQQHNSKPLTRQHYSKFFAIKLTILIMLSILIQGCANSVASLSAPSPSQSETTHIVATSTTTIADIPTLLIQPTATQEIIETPSLSEVLAVRNDSTATPFFLPESTPVPTLILDIPTSTPSPSPTATSTSTSPPLATAVPPTSTPTPLPKDTPLPTETVQSGSEIEHVVLISIDGLRPDALDMADTPILDDLRTKGSYFPSAQTVKQSWTLPSHASMLTGMLPEKHGLLWSLPYIGWPGLEGPTLFNVAHDAGFSTGMVLGKQKLNYLVLGDSVDKLFGAADVHDPEVKDQAVKFIQEGLPDVLFIHFPDVDRVGHEYGWMSTNQLYAVTFVDGMIGEVVAALESGGYLNSTLLIITADHGGHDHSHGDDTPVDRTIPWLAVGPNVPANVIQYRSINTYDTAATVLYALNLPIPDKWDGQPVMEIFQ